MELGRRLHRALGLLFVGEGSLEVRVRREGLVGRVDVLTDRPIEVKSGALPRGGETLAEDRPEYLEQLGMYCALLDAPVGRLIALSTYGRPVPDVAVLDVRYRELPGVRDEMQDRAQRIRESWERQRPETLPRCPWFARGCEYREAGICQCTGDEPDDPRPFLSHVEGTEDRPEVAARLRAGLEERLPQLGTPSVGRFREMIYPRRAWYDRLRDELPEPKVRPPPTTRPQSGTYARLLAAIEVGPTGEVERLPTLAAEPEEEVLGFRGDPVLLHTSRARRAPTAETLLDQSPQYALDLGFRCVAAGRNAGRLVLALERAGPDESPVRVFELSFEPVSTLARLWRGRQRQLEEALRDRAPDRLPACPSWMYEECPYRELCGCGSVEGRSQR